MRGQFAPGGDESLHVAAAFAFIGDQPLQAFGNCGGAGGIMPFIAEDDRAWHGLAGLAVDQIQTGGGDAVAMVQNARVRKRFSIDLASVSTAEIPDRPLASTTLDNKMLA